jgi:hypothetical protein
MRLPTRQSRSTHDVLSSHPIPSDDLGAHTQIGGVHTPAPLAYKHTLIDLVLAVVQVRAEDLQGTPRAQCRKQKRGVRGALVLVLHGRDLALSGPDLPELSVFRVLTIRVSRGHFFLDVFGGGVHTC